MKILLIGSNGQLGTTLKDKLNKYLLLCPSKNALNLEDSNSISNFLAKNKPDLIINSGAYTKVDLAETNRLKAEKINSLALLEIAKYVEDNNKFVIHFSTDYVFNGLKKSSYKEQDRPNPINYYGMTKYLGEKNLFSSTNNFLILRISWVYGHEGDNFPKKIIDLYNERNTLKVINDQYGVPSSTEFISSIVLQIIENINAGKNFNGIYNLCPDGSCTWYDFASELISLMKKEGLLSTTDKNIIPTSSSKFITDAKRPKNSVLNNDKIKKELGVQFPDWRVCLAEYVNEYK